jgi:hypothetical protein
MEALLNARDERFWTAATTLKTAIANAELRMYVHCFVTALFASAHTVRIMQVTPLGCEDCSARTFIRILLAVAACY